MRLIISLVVYLLLFCCSPTIQKVYHTVDSPSGREYYGLVEDGTIEGGKGVLKQQFLRHSYDGKFSQNKFHGQGKMTYANEDIYVGTWENGETIGQGIYYWSDGDSCIVQWNDGLPDDAFLLKAQKHAYANQLLKSPINRNIQATIINTKVVNKFLSVELFVQNFTSSMSFCLYYGDGKGNDNERAWLYWFNHTTVNPSIEKYMFSSEALYYAAIGNNMWYKGKVVDGGNGQDGWFREHAGVFILNWNDLKSTTLSDTFIKYERIFPQSVVEKTRYGTFQPAQQPVYDLPSTGLDVGLTWKLTFDISKLPENLDKYELFFAGNVIEIQNTQ